MVEDKETSMRVSVRVLNKLKEKKAFFEKTFNANFTLSQTIEKLLEVFR